MKINVTNSSNRLPELDALRGIAVSLIVCYHYTICHMADYKPVKLPLFQLMEGFTGVHLFFMISGFVIYMTLEKTNTGFDFIVSRFSRLYPCYWVAVIFSFFIMRTFFLLPGKDSSLDTALINLSMLQYWFHVKSVDGVFWTLTVELLFYVLMYTIFMLRLMKHAVWIGFLWLGLMFLNKYFIPSWEIINFFRFIFSPLLEWGHLFFAGIFFYHLKTKGHSWDKYLGLALCILFQYIADPVSIKMIALWFILFYLFISNRLTWLAQKPLVYLGTISYSLYLIHQNMGILIIQWLDVLGVNAWLKFFLPVGVSVFIATLMTYLIEKPAMAHIKGFYRKIVSS